MRAGQQKSRKMMPHYRVMSNLSLQADVDTLSFLRPAVITHVHNGIYDSVMRKTFLLILIVTRHQITKV